MSTLPRREGLTLDDLEQLSEAARVGWPHDGHRVELLDGVILVSPPPVYRHQGVVGTLHVMLRAACPPDLRVRLAPFAVQLSERTMIEPDLLVARAADFTEKDLPGAPLLAVEVLSRSTRRHDQLVKRQLLEEAGCPSYWMVEPGGDGVSPSLVALELEHGAYVEVARVSGSETWRASRPFALDLTPDLLLDD